MIVWTDVIGYIPELLGALVVFVIGLIVAVAVGMLMEKIVLFTRIDTFLASTGIDKEFERAGVRFNVARFFGRATYWFFLIVTIIAVVNILLPQQDARMLWTPVISFIPNVVAAVLILLGAAILAHFLRGVVQASVVGARLHASKFLGALTWWSIVVFGFMAALAQLNIAPVIIQTLITGVIVMFALAGGIAFGLGGKEYASHLLERFRHQIEDRK